DSAPSHNDAFPVQRQPYFPGSVDGEVLVIHPRDLGFELPITDLPVAGNSIPVLVVGRWGDPDAELGERGADRLDTPSQTTGFPPALVLADVFDDQRAGRSSSAAKKADADSKSRSRV